MSHNNNNNNNKRHKTGEHPLDTSGILHAAKYGQRDAFRETLEAAHAASNVLSVEHVNEIPPGRSYGVVHQIAYHQYAPALELLLEHYPQGGVDFKLLTAPQGQTAHDIAVERGGDPEFLALLRTHLDVQTHQELVQLAKQGKWEAFFGQLVSPGDHHQQQQQGPQPPPQQPLALSAAQVNSVPPGGRRWGIVHQICYWGSVDALQRLDALYVDNSTGHSQIDYQLATSEADAPQVPMDIARGRHGNDAPFVRALQAKLDQAAQQQQNATAAVAATQESTTTTTTTTSAASSKVTAPSSEIKAPVPLAAGHTCQICFESSDLNDPEEALDNDNQVTRMAVHCDNNHYLCTECFTAWVRSESNVSDNPQGILLNGGRILCPHTKHGNHDDDNHCDSAAYANKLIATVVPDDVYELYLRARDYVVGKEAVAGALSKLKQQAGTNHHPNAIEQEQIRNLYRTGEGEDEGGMYAAYMCAQCHFGPIDHGWCQNLQSHQGQAVSAGGGTASVINNACPKCGWFAGSIGEWPRWDGTFLPPSSSLPAAQS